MNPERNDSRTSSTGRSSQGGVSLRDARASVTGDSATVDVEGQQRKNDLSRERYLRALCAHFQLPIETPSYRPAIRHDFGSSYHEQDRGRLGSDGTPKRYSQVSIHGGRSATLYETADGKYLLERHEPVGVDPIKPTLATREQLENLVVKHFELAASPAEKQEATAAKIAAMTDVELAKRFGALAKEGVRPVTFADLLMPSALEAAFGSDLGTRRKPDEMLKSTEMSGIIRRLNDRYEEILKSTPIEKLREHMLEGLDAVIAAPGTGIVQRGSLKLIRFGVRGMNEAQLLEFWNTKSVPQFMTLMKNNQVSEPMGKAILAAALLGRVHGFLSDE